MFFGRGGVDVFVLLASTYVLIATCVADVPPVRILNCWEILNGSISWNGLPDDLMSYLLRPSFFTRSTLTEYTGSHQCWPVPGP